MSPTFQLSLPGFAGPVDALPLLVSARRLEIDDLPLADIAAQFLEQTRRDDELDLREAGEVLSAVARLMYLKSLHLLAQPDEAEEDGTDDDTQSAHDVELVRAAARSLGLIAGSEGYASAPRPGLVPRRAEPRPAHLLLDAWATLKDRIPKEPARAAVPSFVRLEVAVSRLIGRLTSGRPISLQGMLGRAARRDVVVHFLAALELVRTGRARARQSGLYEEIMLEAASDDARLVDRAG